MSKVLKKARTKITKVEHQKYLRQRVRKAVQTHNDTFKNDFNVLAKRQIPDAADDPFTTEIYRTMELLVPPYSFSSLYNVYAESDVLQECIDTMQQNVDGFGYQLHFLGDDKNQRSSQQAQAQYIKTSNFFDYGNEVQSWTKLRKEMRQDYEALGNGGFEVIRNLKKEIQLTYQIPFRTMRLAKVDNKPTRVKIQIMRNGKLIDLYLDKYFRRFVQVKSTGEKARWFKSFGDARVLDAETGMYVTDVNGTILEDAKKPKIEASEIIHFKNNFGGGAYGLPRWLGAVLDIMGRRKAQYVNHDLFDNQGIPPMAIMVSGGTLTDESVEELEALVQGMRGAPQWNKIILLESNLEAMGLEEKGTAKIELKNLTEYRKDDQMFSKYLTETEQTIRHTYRIPDLYMGKSESFTHATAKAARLVAEEQIFIPERKDIDEFVNMQIIKKELGVDLWEYKTKGPKIVGADEMSKGVETFSKAGAFTVNHAVEMANEAFGLQMSKFSETWADYPVPIVLKLLESGQLGELDAIIKEIDNSEVLIKDTVPGGTPKEIETAKENIKKMRSINLSSSNPSGKSIGGPTNVLKLNEKEKKLFENLLTLQKKISELDKKEK